MRTEPKISFGIGYTLSIKQDGTPSMAGLQLFSKIEDLRTDNATNRPYATYEPDFWLLDGEYKFLPENLYTVHVGVMTEVQSDVNGDFTFPYPTLQIDFTEPQSIDGLTFHFASYSNDYSNEMEVEFYDQGLTIIRADTYYPDSYEFYTNQACVEFKRIIIHFRSVNKPYRYLRLTGIDYGEMITFEGAAIQDAKIIEECMPLSVEVPINTFEVQLFSSSGQFSIINPGGDYESLTQRQPITVFEKIGDQDLLLGQYYLDRWENVSNTQIKFYCIDLIGILDSLTYKGGIWITGDGINVEELLTDMLGPIHIPFDLASVLYGTKVKGWIPICSYREAIQQIAFAIGAYVDTSRDKPIKIYPAKIASDGPDFDFALTKEEKGAQQSLALDKLITGVKLTAHDIGYGMGSLELYKNTLPVGQHEIDFKQPCHTLTIAGATILESGANYAIVNVTSPGTVTLAGKVYSDTRRVFSIDTPGLPSSVLPNIVEVTEASLVSSDNAAALAQRLYDYYQCRLIQTVKTFASSIANNDIVKIDTLYNQQILAVVEKTDIDLARGMVSNIELRGVVI